MSLHQIGSVSSEVIRDLRFKRNIRHLCDLGPRVVEEFISEIGAAHIIMTDIENRLERYASLSKEQVEETGGNHLPASIFCIKKDAE